MSEIKYQTWEDRDFIDIALGESLNKKIKIHPFIFNGSSRQNQSSGNIEWLFNGDIDLLNKVPNLGFYQGIAQQSEQSRNCYYGKLATTYKDDPCNIIYFDTVDGIWRSLQPAGLSFPNINFLFMDVQPLHFSEKPWPAIWSFNGYKITLG